MISRIRAAWHRYIPQAFHDPLGLAVRLVRTGDPSARAAMGFAALGLALSPLDLALTGAERRRYLKATPPVRPIILVCGPPRSGTTLLVQTLIRTLPVGYFTNLSALFPRAPLSAMALGGRLVSARKVSDQSYYGRTRYLSGPNDALPIWNRWLPELDRPPEALLPGAAQAIARFFGAFEAMVGRPIMAKNNSLNASAALVAEALPTARFLCLTREAPFLAQSLLEARREIHGAEELPYGLADTVQGDDERDPVLGVCRQVRFHEALAATQVARLGPEKFRMVSYEQFCRAPDAVIRMVAGDLLGLSAEAHLEPIPVSNRVRIPPAEFARIERLLPQISGARP